MSRNKRRSSEKDNVSPSKAKRTTKLNEDSELYKNFIQYQTELDTRNDKHERLVKLSRDVTIQSKRAIFSLLRKEEDVDKVIAEGKAKITNIKKLLEKISEELVDEDFYKFHRAFSPGVQEFVEAISLLHYLENSKLITYTETVKQYFTFANKVNFLTHMDYMLGIADLTGELMRMAINAVSNGEFDLVEAICAILQEMHSSFSVFSSSNRELSRKVNVMRNSLRKVENASYNLKVRGSEVPAHLLSTLFIDSKGDNGNEEC